MIKLDECEAGRSLDSHYLFAPQTERTAVPKSARTAH